jgi:hypothetical protein
VRSSLCLTGRNGPLFFAQWLNAHDFSTVTYGGCCSIYLKAIRAGANYVFVYSAARSRVENPAAILDDAHPCGQSRIRRRESQNSHHKLFKE